MDFNRRKIIIEHLEKLENDFPVIKWQLNEIHVWPILKNLLFFHSFAEKEKKSTSPNVKGSFIFHKIKKGISILKRFFSLKLYPADFVFSGGDVHRAWEKQKFVNRYFDPMIKYLESKDISTIGFEYVSRHQGPINFERIEDLNLIFYKREININSLLDNKTFQEFLFVSEKIFGLSREDTVLRLKSAVLEVNSWKRLFLYIFKKVDPKYCFGLCYYSYPMYGMILAARELGILSIDMQHGTQGRFHPSYFYTSVPLEGYNCLPKEFWCWDKESYLSLNLCSLNTSHDFIISGNPWISYLIKDYETADDLFPKDKPIILFTHQPLKPVLDDYLLKAIIKTKSKYHWWIRLHPRISKEDQDTLERLISLNELDEFIEIEKATKLPLPLVLQKCHLHLSKYSGSIIEAMLTGTFSIILERMGTNIFQQIIIDENAIGLEEPTSNKLVSIIHQEIDSNRSKSSILYNFEQSIDELLTGRE